MTRSIATALKRLKAEVNAGERPEKLVVQDEEYGLYYGDNYFGLFVEVVIDWPRGWFGTLENDTWGGQEGVRYYYERW